MASVLYSDIIDPATLSGYTRAAMSEYEARQGTLARWLPNFTVPDINIRFQKGANGLVPIAKFRAYDAEIERGKREGKKRVTIELPGLGQSLPVTEYDQLRGRAGTISDEQAEAFIRRTARQVARATSDAMEYLRGIVLETGKATIDQDNFYTDDNFGRSASHQVVAGTLFSDAGAKPLEYLTTLEDLYADDNGDSVGAWLMSRRVIRAIAASPALQTQLINGGARPADEGDVRSRASAAGLAEFYLYNRRVRVGNTTVKVLPDTSVYALPAPVEPDEEDGTDLGGTAWGRTLSSQDPDWEIADEEQPGIVVGVYKETTPPMSMEVIADAIGLPFLANADLSLRAKVL